MRTTVLIDLDDTIFDMRRAFEAFHGLHFNSKDEFIEHMLVGGIEKNNQMFKEFYDGGCYEYLQPLPGAKDFLDFLYRNGYHVIFLTARSEILRRVSLSTLNGLWINQVEPYPLDEHDPFIPTNSWELLCLGQEYDKTDKESYIDTLEASCLVDDHYRYKHSDNERVLYFNTDNAPYDYNRIIYQIKKLEKLK